MSDPRADLSAFLERGWDAKPPLPGDADLFDRLGIDGDDGSEFIEAFAARFNVDVSGYRWYFHHGEEGWNLGALFFAPPDRRVKRIPITPDILVEAIETRQWPIRYPEHKLPSVRWDIRLNQLLLVPVVVLLALWIWQRFGQ